MELIPGVQEGARLTLHGLNERLSALEFVVRTISTDYYNTPEPVTQADVVKDGPELFEPLARIAELERLVAELNRHKSDLESEIGELKSDRDYWMNEADEKQDEIYTLTSKNDLLEDRLATIRANV